MVTKKGLIVAIRAFVFPLYTSVRDFRPDLLLLYEHCFTLFLNSFNFDAVKEDLGIPIVRIKIKS